MKLNNFKRLFWVLIVAGLFSFNKMKNGGIGYGFQSQKKSTNNNCLSEKFNLSQGTNKTVIKLDTVYDRREFLIDSLNFEIVIKEYLNGKSIVRSAKNKVTNITYWNQYHDNGEIKWKGYTSGYILRIGKWEHYSEDGKLDSIADYGKSRIINYCEARNIISDSGIEFDDLDYNYNSSSSCWEITNWTLDMKYKINEQKQLTIIK